MEKDTIPFKQKLRPISPLLLRVIEKEVQNHNPTEIFQMDCKLSDSEEKKWGDHVVH